MRAASPRAAAQGPQRVFIVDGQALLREGLRLILDQDPGLEVVGEAQRPAEAVARIRELGPDVVVMGWGLAGTSGIAATRTICSALPDTRVVLLCSTADDETVRAAIRAGALACLAGDSADGERLRRTLHSASSGQVQLPPPTALRLISGSGPPSSAPALTVRENDVLAMLAQGKANKTIARELGLSQETVKTHVKRILEKMGVESRTQAALKVVRTAPPP